MDRRKLQCFTALANPAGRMEAAQRVAALYGSELVLLFQRDPEVESWLPASGFPQTLPDGRKWQAFLKRCAEAGRADDCLMLDASQEPTSVRGIACITGAIIVFVGGDLQPDAYTDAPAILPLLDAALHGERAAGIAAANARLAAERVETANRLADSLEAARLELASALAQSRAVQDELRKADSAKNEFLALLAHELRNPLAPIGNALTLLQQQETEPALTAQAVGIMQRQFTQLVRLIEDLMEVARISNGKISLRKEVVAISTVLDAAIAAAMPQIRTHHHRFENCADARNATVLADPVRLNQVFVNLLINAALYTPEGGQITVTTAQGPDSIAISVTDTGQGIPEQLVPRMFTMFARGGDELSRKSGGLGIGLSLARKLTELHGGKIGVRSRGLGQGSTFTVTLPLHSAAQVDTDGARTDASAAVPSLKVLIVDDNKDSAVTLGWAVEALGHEYRLAYDGTTALQLVETYHPQVVLLDIGMPEMSGYELCAAMKQIPALQRSLFIAQTGWGQQADKVKAASAGFDLHLVKPIKVDELAQILARYPDRPSMR